MIATIVDTVVVRVASPAESPSKTLATPTRPSAPGTSNQNAGRKLAKAAGPQGQRDTRKAIGVIASAPIIAESTPPKEISPMTWAP